MWLNFKEHTVVRAVGLNAGTYLVARSSSIGYLATLKG